MPVTCLALRMSVNSARKITMGKGFALGVWLSFIWGGTVYGIALAPIGMVLIIRGIINAFRFKQEESRFYRTGQNLRVDWPDNVPLAAHILQNNVPWAPWLNTAFTPLG